ncbi:hypothetical protein CYMTET_21489 [Cymbomonas tetramitiformis]|uniref:Uncharacterized protein n=1 Tax=Cymbomonas tetramitiformis TaxID=36881 RepID=A0AAE0G225_9CHLO|nr:hypothetical protein CYMTET_21489 [Cymbomonas tetramitiformis]
MERRSGSPHPRGILERAGGRAGAGIGSASATPALPNLHVGMFSSSPASSLCLNLFEGAEASAPLDSVGQMRCDLRSRRHARRRPTDAQPFSTSGYHRVDVQTSHSVPAVSLPGPGPAGCAPPGFVRAAAPRLPQNNGLCTLYSLCKWLEKVLRAPPRTRRHVAVHLLRCNRMRGEEASPAVLYLCQC